MSYNILDAWEIWVCDFLTYSSDLDNIKYKFLKKIVHVSGIFIFYLNAQSITIKIF